MEVSIEAGRGSPEAASLITVLLEAGLSPVEAAQTTRGRWTRWSVYRPSVSEAEAVARRLAAAAFPGVRLRSRFLRTRDWMDKWRRDLRAFPLGDGFRVVPVWRRPDRREDGRRVIRLSSTRAFGTGLHETTRLMVSLIEGRRGRIRRFLDVGTGGGILAIVAALCGAVEIEALDCDPSAVEAAADNVRINGFEKRIRLRVKDFSSSRWRRSFDFVAANLFSRDLLSLRERLVAVTSPGGRLALSGIGREHLDAVRTGFRGLPLRCLRRMEGRRWAALLYKRIG